MNTSQTYLIFVFSISILCISNAQWYIIKKDYPSNLMNYPNPGKRSVLEPDVHQLQVDCSTSFSHLKSFREKLAWLWSCHERQSTLKSKENSSSSSSSIEDDLSSAPRLILHEKRTARAFRTYMHDNDMPLNRLLKKLLRQMTTNVQT
jgi:hypothetical protein